MNKNKLTISNAARLLGVSAQTLRRWDEAGELKSHRKADGGFRYYQEEELEAFAQDRELDIEKIALAWVLMYEAFEPIEAFYCSESTIFLFRLQAFESKLAEVAGIEQSYPLISASVGEIGNNSFDHNLGKWPDVRGIFFGYDRKRRKVVLADRGQGILKTLSRVQPSLISHSDALFVAFTEILTGRAPEHRGNGLKFVRKLITENPFVLRFQTGNAELMLKQGDTSLSIIKKFPVIPGCFAVIQF